jgi:hypothetical protein
MQGCSTAGNKKRQSYGVRGLLCPTAWDKRQVLPAQQQPDAKVDVERWHSRAEPVQPCFERHLLTPSAKTKHRRS